MCVQAEYAPQSARVPLTTHCIGVSSLVEKLAQALLMQPIICKSIHINMCILDVWDYLGLLLCHPFHKPSRSQNRFLGKYHEKWIFVLQPHYT